MEDMTTAQAVAAIVQALHALAEPIMSLISLNNLES